MNPSDIVLEIDDLRVSYQSGAARKNVEAVAGVSLSVARGEVVAIVGESGSGKSTTALAAIGLLASNARITAGKIALEGQQLENAGERVWRALRGPRIGYVPQDPALSLDPVQRIGEQIAEALTVHGVGRREARDRVDGILSQVGLNDRQAVARSFPHELSGGMRQRILIGIALANDPVLLIADEPTSALDVTVQRKVLDFLEQSTRQRGIAVLLITHDLGVAFDRADRIVVMQQGKIVETGATCSLFESPSQAYTRKLLAAAPGLRTWHTRASATARSNPLGNQLVNPRIDLRNDAAQPPILEAEGLVKVFGRGIGAHGRAAVQDVSLTVMRRGTTAMVGESGSGKSTTARMLLGLETPTTGRIRFDGHDITHPTAAALRAFRRRVQIVYQNPYQSLDPRFTLEAIITEPLRAFGIGSPRTRRERAAQLLESVELSVSLLDSRPVALSGGQRQRVAIARALAISPDLVVLDEPVSALDVSVQAQILALLKRLQQELGVSYLFISHDLAVVREISDQVVVLRAGRVVEHGPTEAVFTQPQADYTRSLLVDSFHVERREDGVKPVSLDVTE